MSKDNVVYLKTPFFAAKKFVGISPEDCLIIDKKQFESIEASQGENAKIIFDINYQENSFSLNERRSITVKEIRQLLNSGMAKIRYTVTTRHYGINLSRLNCKLV